MELIYTDTKTEEICTSLKAAKRLFGGNDQWRIILEPLDKDKKPYKPCNIDEISQNVRIIGIMEVSKHYE